LETQSNQLRALLPRIPDEAFDIWLRPHAQNVQALALCRSLPSSWGKCFLGESLNFWQVASWTLVELRLGALPLDASARSKLDELVTAWDARDITGSWPPHLLQNSPERIESVLTYIKEEQALPKAIVCLNRSGQWQIADGYHRLAAAFIASPAPSKPVRVWLAQNAT
jgi:ParB-like nuclease domain